MDIEALEAKKHKDLDEAIAITDVDPRYFSELDARLVREKFSVRKYVEDCREILKYRLLAGQQMDDCIRIDQQFVEEQKRLDKIKVFVLNQKKKKKEKIFHDPISYIIAYSSIHPCFFFSSDDIVDT